MWQHVRMNANIVGPRNFIPSHCWSQQWGLQGANTTIPFKPVCFRDPQYPWWHMWNSPLKWNLSMIFTRFDFYKQWFHETLTILTWVWHCCWLRSIVGALDTSVSHNLSILVGVCHRHGSVQSWLWRSRYWVWKLDINSKMWGDRSTDKKHKSTETGTKKKTTPVYRYTEVVNSIACLATYHVAQRFQTVPFHRSELSQCLT